MNDDLTYCEGCERDDVPLVTTGGYCRACRDACYRTHDADRANALVGDDIEGGDA